MSGGQEFGGSGGGVLARKLARARGAAAAPAPEVDFDFAADLGGGGDLPDFGTAPPPDPALRAWRIALARAARDHMGMSLGFAELSLRDASLTEVLETPMQRALILMLQGRGEGMGLLILSGQMLAAMIEMMTLTRLSPTAPEAEDLRKPTRTDAAMAVDFVDAVLANFEQTLGAESWAAHYRYAAFIDDPRPLHLMLDDGDYHLLSCDLALEEGHRSGQITLALPHAAQPLALPDLSGFAFEADLAPAPLAEVDDFTQDLAEQVQDLSVALDASLTRIALPLDRVLRLQPGEVLVLPLANLDQIALTGVMGQRLAGAKLGQNRGMRALRLTDPALARLAPAAAADAALPDNRSQPLPEPPAPLALADALADPLPDIGPFGGPLGDVMASDQAMPDFTADFPPFSAAL